MAKNARRASQRLKVQTADSDPEIGAAVARADAGWRRGEILDKTRPYGKVAGNYVVTDDKGRERSVSFEQKTGRGKMPKLFDHEGVRIYRPGEARRDPLDHDGDGRKGGSVPRRQRAPEPADLDDEDDDDEEDLPPMVSIPAAAGSGPPIVDAEEGDVNITAWAQDRVQYRFALVREAVLSRYGRECPTEKEACDFLLEQGVNFADSRLIKAGFKAPGA